MNYRFKNLFYIKKQNYRRDSYRVIGLQVLYKLFSQAQEFFIGNCNFSLYFHVLCQETKRSDVARCSFYLTGILMLITFLIDFKFVKEVSGTFKVAGSL